MLAGQAERVLFAHGQQRVSGPEIAKRLPPGIADFVIDGNGRIIRELDPFAGGIRKHGPGALKKQAVIARDQGGPLTACPFAELGKRDIAPEFERIGPFVDIGEAVVHPAEVVIHPRVIGRDGPVRPGRRHQELLPGREM